MAVRLAVQLEVKVLRRDTLGLRRDDDFHQPCSESNDVQLITAVDVEPADAQDQDALIPVLDQLDDQDRSPAHSRRSRVSPPSRPCLASRRLRAANSAPILTWPSSRTRMKPDL